MLCELVRLCTGIWYVENASEMDTRKIVKARRKAVEAKESSPLLNSDVLRIIFQESAQEDLVVFAYVCKDWNNAADTPDLWKTVDLSSWCLPWFVLRSRAKFVETLKVQVGNKNLLNFLPCRVGSSSIMKI